MKVVFVIKSMCTKSFLVYCTKNMSVSAFDAVLLHYQEKCGKKLEHNFI